MDQLRTGTITKVRARRRCWHCSEWIEVGESAVFQVNADAGDIWTIRMHTECEKACQTCDAFHFEECTGGECKRGLVANR